MNKEYLKYLFKTHRNLNIFLLVINLLFTMIYFINIHDVYNSASYFSIIFVIVIIECLVLPIVELSIIQNRRSVDMFYSLTVKHNEIIITTYISVISKIYIILLISSLPVILYSLVHISVIGLIGYLIVSFLLIACVSLFTMGINLKCNSIIDSFVILSGYILMPLLVYLVLEVFFDYNIANVILNFGYSLSSFFLPAAVYKIFYEFASMMLYNDSLVFNLGDYINVIVYTAIGLGFTLYELKNRKPERAEQITDAFFTYPLVIGVTTLCFLLSVMFTRMDFKDTILYVALTFIAYSIMNFVYIRKVTFTKKSVLLFVLAIVLSFGAIKLSDITDGFGLVYSYRNCKQIRDVNFHASIDLMEDDYKGYYIESYKINESQELIDYLREYQDNHVQKEHVINDCDSCTYHYYSYISIVYDDSLLSYRYSMNRSGDDGSDIRECFETLDKFNDIGIEFYCYDYEGNGMDYAEWKEAVLSALDD